MACRPFLTTSVSIHAPRVRGDLFMVILPTFMVFQFTPLV